MRGLLTVLLGVLAFAGPGMTLVVLIVLFGAYAIVDGVLGIVAAVRASAALLGLPRGRGSRRSRRAAWYPSWMMKAWSVNEGGERPGQPRF